MLTTATKEGCRILVENCAMLQPGEKALIVSDSHTESLGKALTNAAGAVTDYTQHCVVPAFSIHGQEPPPYVAREMHSADVIFGLTRMSMAHTMARLNASQQGGRYLSLPDYSQRALESQALRVDFSSIAEEADLIASIFSQADSIRIRSDAGTDLTCDVRGRQGNSAPGFCQLPGSLASPPDAEANVPPREDHSHGVIVVNGSIPCKEIGLVDSPATLLVEAGRVTNVTGELAPLIEEQFSRPAHRDTRVVAEIGVGLNPEARLCGSMLEDEGCRNTCHIGIGSNITIGGTNAVPFHLDFVMKDVCIEADGVAFLEYGRMYQEQSL